ncbi:unnamed protein product [Didymodactylos carnosus]|nr:unnamed protein product [Didymodactylos carnosus]CAF4081141.1 unnamed protein product [Didymodactylos carnosus]
MIPRNDDVKNEWMNFEIYATNPHVRKTLDSVSLALSPALSKREKPDVSKERTRLEEDLSAKLERMDNELKSIRTMIEGSKIHIDKDKLGKDGVFNVKSIKLDKLKKITVKNLLDPAKCLELIVIEDFNKKRCQEAIEIGQHFPREGTEFCSNPETEEIIRKNLSKIKHNYEERKRQNIDLEWDDFTKVLKTFLVLNPTHREIGEAFNALQTDQTFIEVIEACMWFTRPNIGQQSSEDGKKKERLNKIIRKKPLTYDEFKCLIVEGVFRQILCDYQIFSQENFSALQYCKIQLKEVIKV